MKFINSKVAIALSLAVMSNMLVDTFVDDDIDYNNSNITSGWGWLGISSAHADMNCSPGRGETSCTIVVDPCDVYDCNEPPPERPPMDWPPEDPPEDGGGGGGSDTEPTPNPVNPNIIDMNKDRINDCWKGLYGNNASGANLSSDWGWRNYDGELDFHPGWDIGTAGQSGVEALFLGDARVLGSGYDEYNGNWIEYELITDGTFVKYIHLASAPTVITGNVYDMGAVAGIIGNTGQNITAIHLHAVMYPSKQAYDAAKDERRGKSDAEQNDIDFRSSIDPASKLNSSVCPFPSSVKSSNNTKPSGPGTIKPPCKKCQLQ